MNRHFRRGPLGAALVLALSAGLTGCSAGGSDQGTDGTSNADESFGAKPVPAVQELVPSDLKGKELKNGIYNNYPPEYFMEGDKLVGVQIDLTNAVAATAGLKVNLIPVGSFDALIPGMASGRYDFSSGDFGITAERIEQADFVSHWDMGTSFVTTKESGIIIEADTDLCGKRVGVEKGSYYVDQVEAINDECTRASLDAIDLKAFPSDIDALLAVKSGRIDVTGGTSDYVAYVAKEQGEEFVVSPLEYEPVPLGFGFPKGSPLAKVIQAATQEIIRNGVYAKVLKKWDLEDVGYTDPANVRINPTVPAEER